MQEGIGTEEDFKNLYGWFIDAMFQKLSNCNKEEGTSRELKRFSIITNIRDKLRSHRQGSQELNRIQQSTAVLVQSTNRNPSRTCSTSTTSTGSSSNY